MRRLLPVVLALCLGCQPPLAPLVFELPGGERAREATFDFGPRGAAVTRTLVLINTGDEDVTLGEPAFEGEAGLDAVAFAVGGLSSGPLAAGGQLPVTVRFTPSAEHAGRVLVRDGSGREAASLSLAGRLDAARCALPEVVDFGALLVGESPQVAVPFPVLASRREVFVGAPGVPFQLAPGAPAGTHSVAANEAFVAKAQLPAAALGEWSATWRLDPGGDCAPVEVPVRATVLDAFLSASPRSVDLGVVAPPAEPTGAARLVNALSRPVTVALSVTGPGGGPTSSFRVALAQVELPAATRDATGAWRPGELEVPVTATLLGAGALSAVLVAQSDAPAARLEVPLVVRGAGAGLSVSPSPVDLGTVFDVAGQRLPVATGVTVRNDDERAGAATRTITRVTVEGAPGTQAGELCAGAFDDALQRCLGLAAPLALAPGAEASLALRAKPSGDGPWRWSVVLETDDPEVGEFRFEVNARRGAGSDACTLLHATALELGPVRAPTPVVHALELANQGSGACVVQGLWVDGAPDVRAAPAFFTLAPAERRLVDVEYLPTGAPGTARSGALRFAVNSPTAPLRAVAVTGRSDDGCLVVSPEQWDFGALGASCGPRAQAFALGNRCTGEEIVLNGARLVGSGAFTLEAPTVSRLAAGTLVADALRVSLGASSTGLHAVVLELEVAATGGSRTLRVPLRGQVSAAARQRDRLVLPSSVDALLLQDASAGAGALQRGLGARAAEWLDLARARRASVRLGGVYAEPGQATSGQLRDLAGRRWLELGTATPADLAGLLEVGSARATTKSPGAVGLAALTGATLTGANAGFLRRGASLEVASLSNADDASPQPLALLVAQARALKGSQRPEAFSWSAVGPFSPATSGCTYEGATGAATQRALARQLGGAEGEFCQVLQSPASFEGAVLPTLFGGRDAVVLRAPIAAGALPTVTLNGAAVPELGQGGARNWTWDVTRRAVTFAGVALRPGDVVELEYPTLCAP
jgi:hypothetical protein